MGLSDAYNLVADGYIQEFSKKQNLRFYGWVGNEVGDVATFGDYFFNYSDIRFDINTNQSKHNILDWHDNIVDNNGDGPNYKNWGKV